ncbi:hypothetical protein [Croceicoccus sp. Ery15]|uniref:hypothetical protein n=1 Tax=Croceicoccus sp. Ery15 TaxID=1703338 RepID=UPI001E37FF39|nr:hypothetical protein [Croceicoccus sp. Ery15]
MKLTPLLFSASILATISIGSAGLSHAQTTEPDNNYGQSDAGPVVETQAEGLETLGQTADTGVGTVGNRIDVDQSPQFAAPLNTRIPNRIQNRLRNRIDEKYDPMSNALAPFDTPDDRVRRKRPR